GHGREEGDDEQRQRRRSAGGAAGRGGGVGRGRDSCVQRGHGEHAEQLQVLLLGGQQRGQPQRRVLRRGARRQLQVPLQVQGLPAQGHRRQPRHADPRQVRLRAGLLLVTHYQQLATNFHSFV
ncbi:hypothetical protein CFC21_037519, partial [Triticum aestivum]